MSPYQILADADEVDTCTLERDLPLGWVPVAQRKKTKMLQSGTQRGRERLVVGGRNYDIVVVWPVIWDIGDVIWETILTEWIILTWK